MAAYRPKLSDLDNIDYRPSLKNLEEPEVTSRLPKSTLPKSQSGFGELLKLHEPQLEEEPIRKEVLGNLGKGSLGALQSAINTPATIGNVFGLGMPEVQLTPKSLSSEIGGIAGSLPTAFGPGGIARSLPFVQQGLHALRNMPLLNALTRTAGRGAESALFGAAMDPENKLHGAEFGGGLGASASIGSQLLRTRNPFINLLAKLGIGAGVGYPLGESTGYGGKTGAATGMAAMLGLPRVSKELGFGYPPGTELLEHITPGQVAPRIEAANRLRTRITPSEASGNPLIGAEEGRLGKTGEAATYRTRAERIKFGEQERAINRTLNTIFDEPNLGPEVTRLYGSAYSMPVSQQLSNAIPNTPLIRRAINEVNETPAYQEIIHRQNIQPNSFQYLDLVKRRLNDMEQHALDIHGNPTDESRIIGETRDNFNQLLRHNNPDYAAANDLSQRQITRREIESSLKKSQLTGKNFFDKILNNRIEYRQLLRKLRNVPEAQQQIRDMHLAWEFLSNPQKPGAAAFRSQSSLDMNRNTIPELIDRFYGLFGHRSNVEALRMIYNPNWNRQFETVRQIQNARERNDRLIDLLGRYATAAGIEYKEKF